MNKKKIAALCLSLLVTLGASGCESLLPVPETVANGPAADTSPPQAPADTPPGYFGLAYYTAEPVSPVASRTRINRILLEILYEGLFVLDQDFNAVPVLCETFESDGSSWTFTLKEGLTFWSGAPVTAEDVAACWQAAMDDENSPYHARFADVEALSPAGRKLSVTLRTPNIDLPRLLDVPICRAGTAEDTFADGTGPYRPIQDGDSWSLVRNEHWQGGLAEAFESVRLVATSRAEALLYGFETGDISLTRAERLAPKANAVTGATNVYQTRTTDFHYLGVNHSNGALGQATIRQAVSLLIQRSELCSNQLQNHADPVMLPVNPQPAGVSGDTPDPLALLADAGFADNNGDGILDYIPPPTRWYTPYWHEKFAPVILVNSDNSYKVAAAQAIAETLQAAGIGATVNALPYDEYMRALERGNFDMYYGETKLTPDFDIRPLAAADGALNFGGYNNEEFEATLTAARTSEDKSAFYTAFSNALPVIPIAFERCQVVTRAGLLENFNPYPYQIFAGIENWEAR